MVLVADEAAHPPDAAILFVTVYVPGVLDARFTSPVDVLTNTNPAGVTLNTPHWHPDQKPATGLLRLDNRGLNN